MRYGELLRVDLHHFRGVFVVDEDFAFAVGDREFGFATQRDRAYYRAIGCVDDSGVLSAAVEGKHALGDAVVGDGVGIGVGLRGADCLQSLEIENGGGVGAAAADEAAAEIWGDSDAVDAGRDGDVAFDGVGVGVHDDNVCALGNIDPAGGGIFCDVVPAIVTGNGNCFDDVIAGGARRGGAGGRSDDGNCGGETGDC